MAVWYHWSRPWRWTQLFLSSLGFMACIPESPSSRAAAGNGALWRNGASGLLRTNFRNKQVVSAGSSHSPQAAAAATEVGEAPGGGGNSEIPGRTSSAPTGRHLSEVPNAAETHARDQQQQGASVSGRSGGVAARGAGAPQAGAPPGLQGLQPEALRIVTPPPGKRPPRHHPEVMSIHDQVCVGIRSSSQVLKLTSARSFPPGISRFVCPLDPGRRTARMAWRVEQMPMTIWPQEPSTRPTATNHSSRLSTNGATGTRNLPLPRGPDWAQTQWPRQRRLQAEGPGQFRQRPRNLTLRNLP